jgi:hypothetical protein
LSSAATSSGVGIFADPVLLDFFHSNDPNKSETCDEQPLPRIRDRREYAQCT